MPKIIQLSPHIANLIAAGEVVERPASVAKELLENAVDAGATKVTIEIRDGGMTFLRVTDNGCGMTAEDARTAFLRHATSKLRCAEDLNAIGTMGFRGEALAAISSVSRIDLLTKTPDALTGVSLHLEAGAVTEENEAGCPDGTTIIIRDLFYNTPARMKFMKADTVEGSRVAGAVQLQALAHPDVAISLIRDGKTVLSTPGTGGLQAAVYCVYGRDFGSMVPVDSTWEKYHVSGFVSKPTDARPSRNLQTFFVNHRPVKSRLLVTALEEAYRNQLMVGKFPTCVLCLELPPTAVDVNVHPAKTEVKFLNEKAVFDCVHYGVLGALNKTPDRPQIRFSQNGTTVFPETAPEKRPERTAAVPPKKDFFRTMSAQDYKVFSQAVQSAPKPDPAAARAAAAKIPERAPLRSQVILPTASPVTPPSPPVPVRQTVPQTLPELPAEERLPEKRRESVEEPEQTVLDMPKEIPWRMVGELYRTYILIEQGDEAFLIDKHAAHERILFEQLAKDYGNVPSQMLLVPVQVNLTAAEKQAVLQNIDLLTDAGIEAEDFGGSTVVVRAVPADVPVDDVEDMIVEVAAKLIDGGRDALREKTEWVLHSIACRAAIKAGDHTNAAEMLALAQHIMDGTVPPFCPHGRPCVLKITRKELEKQFGRLV